MSNGRLLRMLKSDAFRPRSRPSPSSSSTSRCQGFELLRDYTPTILRPRNPKNLTAWACAQEEADQLAVVQRQLFEILQAFVREWESWAAGLIVRATEPQNGGLLSGLRLARNDFATLRDLYIQVYETCFQALPFAAGLMNGQMRGHQDLFGPVPPALLKHKAKAKAPGSLAAFADLPNATKVPWLQEWPAAGHRHDYR